jgi:hypothetical protein
MRHDDDDSYGPESDRRQVFRRAEDHDLRDEVDALRFAVFGHKDAPETGLMARHRTVERKIDRLTWLAVLATVTGATDIITRAASG